MIVDRLRHPVILAPLAGGPSTPELAAAVSCAGGLGFLAAGYLSAETTRARIRATRRLTGASIGLNLFHPGAGPSDAAAYSRYLGHLRVWAQAAGVQLGEPRYSDDDWEAKLALLADEPVEVVSVTFGCPSRKEVQRLKATGAEVWITVTTPEEAQQAALQGADVLVVQGAEAGGHRASFRDRPGAPGYGLLPLLALVQAELAVPVVASGGIATGRGLAAAVAAGARAAQLGSAFMLTPEAGTAEAHRAALRREGATTLTRAFTGRLARAISNDFISAHSDEAACAYPELHYVTAPMRAAARERGDAEQINLWAGEAHALAREEPAAEVVARLADEARVAAGRAAGILGSG